MASERKMVTENIRRHLLKEYMLKETARAGFGGIDIQRTPMGTRVTLFTERPGIVIGRRGSEIKKLTAAVQDVFQFDNPQIEVEEVRNPYLNSQIMAEKLASALERGWHFRRAGHSTVRNIMRAGAKGCLVVISGKLTGQRHRTEKFKAGHIKFCGDTKLKFMGQGFAVATLKLGVIGVKVSIMDPESKLPDEVTVKPRAVEAAAVPAVPATPDAPAPGADDVPTVPAVPDEAAEAVKKMQSKAKSLRKKGVDLDLEADDGVEVDIVKAIPPKGAEDAEEEKKEVKK